MENKELRAGDIVVSADGSEEGCVVSIQHRYCAACQMMQDCALVSWPDGKKTRPCKAGLRLSSRKREGVSVWQIM